MHFHALNCTIWATELHKIYKIWSSKKHNNNRQAFLSRKQKRTHTHKMFRNCKFTLVSIQAKLYWITLKVKQQQKKKMKNPNNTLFSFLKEIDPAPRSMRRLWRLRFFNLSFTIKFYFKPKIYVKSGLKSTFGRRLFLFRFFFCLFADSGIFIRFLAGWLNDLIRQWSLCEI